MKYFILALGCQMNISDSERIRTIMNSAGFTESPNEEEADILGVIACSVRQKSIDKVYSRINKWNKRKDRENVITFLSGCVLPDDKKKFLKLFDMVFATPDMANLPEMIRQYGVVTPASFKQVTENLHSKQNEFWNINPDYISPYEAYIPIQNGCNNFCTYCAVPYTRGREISRSSGEILKEVDTLVQNGYQSITLLGQNVNSYGLDKKGNEIDFPELMRCIGQKGKESGSPFRLYFTAPHPKDMNEKLIKVISEYPNLGKQIHLPLQSGNDKVLKRMNRKYSVADYRRTVEKIRHYLPEATLFTDIIVGFSGETEKQFEATLNAFDEFKFNMAFIAVYSPRPGAKSAEWDDDIPMSVKKERLHLLSEAFTRTATEFNQKMIGKTCPVLVTGKSRDGSRIAGITEGKTGIQLENVCSVSPGEWIQVEVTGTSGISLSGKAVIDESATK